MLTAAHCVTSASGYFKIQYYNYCYKQKITVSLKNAFFVRKPESVLVGDIRLEPENGTPSNNRMNHMIEKIYIHPEYKPPLKYNDIALIKLRTNVKLSKSTRPACLPQAEDRIDRLLHVKAAGWGLLEFGGKMLAKYPTCYAV